MDANKKQEIPAGNGQKVVDIVINDIIQRAEEGKEHYGIYLRTMNGKDALIEAYEEALDLVMYLRQAILEREEDRIRGECEIQT